MMLRAIEDLPVNFGILGKGASGEAALVEQVLAGAAGFKIHEDYGVDFPAADLLSPTFVDDLRAQSDSITFLKPVRIDDQDCFHIAARGSDQDMELWIANDAVMLPVRYLFRTREKGQTTEYEATFSDWKMNPDLPATMFRFTPPPGSREVRMVSRNEKPSPGAKK